MNLINTDESAELTIECPANRTFDLTVNLNRDTVGKNYKMTVKKRDDTVLLSFAVDHGLTILTRAVRLLKTPAQMGIPTGCYQYDLVEIAGSAMENVFRGWFIVKPSFTLNDDEAPSELDNIEW
ncbi:hypothetical protein [Spirosoma aerolatum]|uniref:hypothetical protein n=1 Tax=Spirosoma aerolatum TaxID=1211326 RepID=UPI0009ADB093|nr:hypothetical protein [Spirosoma aerolatum]